MKGDYALPPSGPSVWNSLPVHVGNATATDTFKSAVRPYHSTPKLSESLNSCLIYSLSLSLSLSLRVCAFVCVRARTYLSLDGLKFKIELYKYNETVSY